MPQAMQYGLWGLVGSLMLSTVLYYTEIVPVFLATFGIFAIAVAIVVAIHTLGTHHWPATIPLVAIAVTFLAVAGIQTYLAYQPRTQDALERRRESVDTTNAARITPSGLRSRQALLVTCVRLDEEIGGRVAAELNLIRVPTDQELGDALKTVDRQLARLEERARQLSARIDKCLNEARGKTGWDTLKESLPDFSQTGKAGGLIALGLILFGIGFAMSKVKIGPAWVASTLGGLVLIAGLVWLFFGADIARAVAGSGTENGTAGKPNDRFAVRFPPVAQASVTASGEGLVFLKGLPYFPTANTVQPGQCARVWIEGAVQPGWEHMPTDRLPLLNRMYLAGLRTGRNPMLAETTILLGKQEFRFEPERLERTICNKTNEPQYVAFKTNGWGSSGDSLTVKITPQ